MTEKTPEETPKAASKRTRKPKNAEGKTTKAKTTASATKKPSRTYVMSHRLQGLDQDACEAAGDRFAQTFSAQLEPSVSLFGKTTQTARRRQVRMFEAESEEVVAKIRAFNPDVVVEEVRPRQPQVALPQAVAKVRAAQTVAPTAVGSGADFSMTVHFQGRPASKMDVAVVFNSIQQPGHTTQIGDLTNAAGAFTISYDPTRWTVSFVFIDPSHGAWSMLFHSPASGLSIDLTPLPRTGPLGWWHLVSGVNTYSHDAGKGVKVGVVDTGCGPHPYLTQVHDVGAFINGDHLTSPGAGLDARNHGTHVTGLIGARPTPASGDYCGLASGAEIHSARVFSKFGGGNQGDIAAAIDWMGSEVQADLINLSLGDTTPSQIELDAILTALSDGALCVASAGNGSGGPLMFPAAYAQTAAVTGLGLTGTSPPNTAAAYNLPTQANHFGVGGLYLASFSNVGFGVTVTAPGNGIISTVPSEDDAPYYLALDGTSMAAPIATAGLASALSLNPAFSQTPRTERPLLAFQTLAALATSIGLQPAFQGAGLARAMVG